MFDLVQTIEEWNEPRILVVGDLMLDRYSHGIVERISPEAPVPILSERGEETRLGGAASVAGLLAHLGCSVKLAGLVGTDTEGRTLRELLERGGVDASLVRVDEERPTTTKHRFLGRSEGCQAQQILRVDRESRWPAGTDHVAQWLMAIESQLPALDAVLVSDYGKGVCTTDLVQRLTELTRRSRLPIVVDPARGADPFTYARATCLTPNRFEAAAIWNESIDTVDDALRAASELRTRLDLIGVILTLDADGIVLACSDRTAHFPTAVRDVCDITGAGDVVLAVVGICLAYRQDLPQAVRLANFAAGIEVQRVGVALITREELLAELAVAECWTPGPSS